MKTRLSTVCVFAFSLALLWVEFRLQVSLPRPSAWVNRYLFKMLPRALPILSRSSMLFHQR